MRKYDEVRFQHSDEALEVKVRYGDQWFIKEFPPHWTARDVLARLELCENPKAWQTHQGLLEEESKIFRGLLFQTHFGEGHTPIYGEGVMRCDACGIDFNKDSGEEIAERQVATNHKRFVAHIQREGA